MKTKYPYANWMMEKGETAYIIRICGFIATARDMQDNPDAFDADAIAAVMRLADKEETEARDRFDDWHSDWD